MVALSRSAIDATKDRADCQVIAERYGLRRASGTRGGWQLYHRPGETEKHPSFGIKPDGWKDFAKEEHGDAIALVQMITGCSFTEAVAALGGNLASDITTVYTPPKATVRTVRTVTATWQQAALTVVTKAEQYLWSDMPDAAQARTYLRQKRGLTDDTIKQWRLGFLPIWEQTTYPKDVDKFASVAPGITIPTFIDSKLEALKVRTRTKSDLPKYLHMAGSNSSPLFGSDLIRAGQPVVIVEGEFDAMIGNQHAGDLATFVTIGSASNTVTDTTRERLEMALRIIVAPDNDEAGEGGEKRLTDALPLAMVATIPTGKDVTEFVTNGGNLRQWVSEALATSPELTLAALPDGVRSAALHCKLDAALIVYEIAKAANLTTFTKKQVYEAAQRLDTGVTQSMVYRGVNQRVFSKPSLYSEDVSIDQNTRDGFENEQSKHGLYQLCSLDEIKAGLEARLRFRLIERAIPATVEALPPFDADLLTAAGVDDPASVAPDVQTIADDLQTGAERADSSQRLTSAKRKLEKLLAAMHKRHITPICWVSGVDFAAQYYRAIHEADPHPRSEYEIALIVGRNSKHIDGLLDRAGVESTRRQDVTIQLDDPLQIDATITSVFQQAKGNGRIGAVRSYDGAGQGEVIPFTTASEVKTWANAEMDRGRKVKIVINLKNEQKVVRGIDPTCKLRVDTLDHDWPAAPYIPQHKSTEQSSAQAVNSNHGVKLERYTGEGYDPAYARATLIKLHARQQGNSVDDPIYADLAIDDLISFIVEAAKLTGNPIIDDLMFQHGGKLTVNNNLEIAR